MLKFTEEHEWLKLDGDVATVGISEYAATQLGDLVFVELPEVGAKLEKGDRAATVESVKAASDIYAPVAGVIAATNGELAASPERVNEDAFGAWMFRIKPAQPADIDKILDARGYEKAASA